MSSRSLIIELYKNPLNKRKLPRPRACASGANPLCGDRLRVCLKIGKNGKITDAAFDGEGCAISMASASLLTEAAKNKTPKSVSAWNSSKIFKLLQTKLSPARLKCGLLALETMQNAIKKNQRKP